MGGERYPDPLRGWRPLGRALLAHHRGRREAVLRVHREDGVVEDVPTAVFFRGPSEMEEWELLALELARGRVLDVGAGAGAHSLALQDRGLDVTAVEALPELVAVLRERGVERVVETALDAFRPAEPFDTVLLLMNGSSLAGSVESLPAFFETLDRLLAPGGRVVLDSTDLREPGPGGSVLDDGRYVGELHYQLEFEGERGDPFPHLFLDPELLAGEADEAGWKAEVRWRGPRGRYLARIARSSSEAIPGRPRADDDRAPRISR